MKPVAECLRELRRRADSPTYRQLSAVAYISHNALSQIGAGRHIGWDGVVKYIEALNKYRTTLGKPSVVTPADWAELERLHEQVLRHRRARDRAATSELGELIAVRHRITQDPARISDLTTAANLDSVHSLDGLVDRLADILYAVRGVKVSDLHAEQAMDFSWFSPSPEAREIRTVDARFQRDKERTEEWEVLTKRVPPTKEIVFRLLRRHGATDGDCEAWSLAWNRVTEVPPEQPSSARTAGLRSRSGRAETGRENGSDAFDGGPAGPRSRSGLSDILLKYPPPRGRHARGSRWLATLVGLLAVVFASVRA